MNAYLPRYCRFCLHYLVQYFLLAMFYYLPSARATEIPLTFQSALEIIYPEQTPVLDGKLNDPFWLYAPSLSNFVTLLNGAEGPPVAASEIMLAYDRQYLYLALRAWDPQPQAIRGNWHQRDRRDQINNEQDNFTVYLDPTGLGKQAQFFSINAGGGVADGIYHVQSQRHDFATDFQFVAVAHTDEHGWSAEIRIPLNQIRIGGQTRFWALAVIRNYVRGQAWHMRSPILVRDKSCFLCEKPLPSGADFWPQPMNLPLNLQAIVDPAAGNENNIKGMDLTVRATPNVMLEASVRGEAAGAENVGPLVYRQFAAQREEERQFFLSDADLFPAANDSGSLPNSAVYTPSITDQVWGVRASMRDSRLQAVWLTSFDNGGGKILQPSAYQTDFINQPASMVTISHTSLTLNNLKLGTLFSDRDYNNLGYNRVLGPDLVWQVNNESSVRAHWLHSQTTARLNQHGDLARQEQEDGQAQRIEYKYRSKRWEGTWYAERVSPGFRADNGFFSQAGYVTQYTQLTHKYGARAGLHEINLLLTLQDVQDWQGNTIKHGLRPALYLGGPRESSLYVELASHEQQRINANGQLHTLSFVALELSSSLSNTLPQASLKLNLGDRLDVETDRKLHGSALELKLTYRPLKRLDMRLYLLQEWLRARDAAGRQSDRALQWVSNWEVDANTSVRLSLVRGKAARNRVLTERIPEPNPLESGDALHVVHRMSRHTEILMGFVRNPDGREKRDFYARVNWRF